MVKENEIKKDDVSRLHKISEAIQLIAAGDLSAKIELSDNVDEIDSVACGINMMAEELRERMVNLEYVNNRVEKVVDVIQKVASGNFEAYCELTDKNDIFDALGVGVNMMVDDIKVQIEEIEKLHSRVVQSEKMSAVGQLAGGVAHEINNPMSVILGFAQIVVRGLKEDDPLYVPLKSIEKEAIRCKKLVNDLLTFSRTGKTEKEKVDINEIIDQTISLVEARTKISNIKVVREYDTGLPRITVNKNQTQQVIINLCNNAIDAMPEGGKITITTKKAVNGKRETEDGKTKQPSADSTEFVEISVIDTGSGMSEEIKKHIFEPFFTTKEIGKGTGLGLSLVYEIIQKHNGTIKVETEIGKGTIFIIKFPVI